MATVLVSAPANGLKGVKGHQVRKEQEPAATTKRAGAKRRCALQPGGRLPGCKAQVTARKRASHPERMLQACR